MHRPDAIVDGFESKTFSRKHLADKDELATPAHAAVGPHLGSSKISWINDLRDTLRIDARGGPIARCRNLALERPVRSLLVVASPEALQQTLLRGQVGR